jgi:hypothetical protein
LCAFAFFERILDHVVDCAIDILDGVEKNFPASFRPHCGNQTGCCAKGLKRMQAVFDEAPCRGKFKMSHDIFCIAFVSPNNCVDVLRENRQRVEVVGLLFRDVAERFGNHEGLASGDFDGRVLERAFRTESQLTVVFVACERTALVRRRGGAEAEEFPGTDEIRP